MSPWSYKNWRHLLMVLPCTASIVGLFGYVFYLAAIWMYDFGALSILYVSLGTWLVVSWLYVLTEGV